MSALLSAELLKLRTTRTFVGMAGAALALSLLITVLVTTLSDDWTAEDAADLLVLDASSFFILLLGAIGITGEWRHRTITSSLLAAPDRFRFLAAKVIAYAAAGAVLSLVVTLAVAGVGTAILSARGETTVEMAEALEALWRNALVAALLGGLGVAVGSVVRNQAGAIVTLLVLAFMVEPTLGAVEPDVGKFMPVAAAPASIREAEDGAEDDDLLEPLAAVGVELLWIAGLATAGGLLLRRRDL